MRLEFVQAVPPDSVQSELRPLACGTAGFRRSVTNTTSRTQGKVPSRLLTQTAATKDITAMSKWVENYVKGCTKCQQNKTLTHRTTPPPYKIDVPPTAQPFEVVAMDLITQLPNSHGYDAILTIVDHGCTRAALFLPCTTNVTGEGIAKLYLDNVYRWFGIPSKIISDRDPR